MPLAALAAMLAALSSSASALGPEDVRGRPADSLPNLYGSGVPAPGYFHLSAQSAGLGYNSRLEKWGAKVERYTTLDPALTMDYGLQLTNRFGAGGMLTHQNDHSEVVLNGIYAPKRNLRFRIAGAQLRALGSAPGADTSNAFLQNSYLFGARKYWDKYEHLSDIGISAYSIGANAPSAAQLPVPAGGDPFDAAMLARGRMDGYQFNLSLRPTPLSRLELRHEASHLTYYFDAGLSRQEPLVANRIRYAQDLGHCMQLQGGYSAGADADRMDIGFAKRNWNIRLSHELDGAGSASAIHLGYVIPMGERGRSGSRCATRMMSRPAFEPVAEAAKQRPQQFPRAPLVTTGAP